MTALVKQIGNKIDVTFTHSPTNRRETTGVIIHHLDSENAGVMEVHKWHLARGFHGIGYNFIVRLNGAIEWGRGINTIGAHTASHNHNTVGIGFEGRYNSTTKTMPEAQFKAGVKLIKHIQKEYGNNLTVKQHSDYSPTACAGSYFPLNEMVNESMKTKQTSIPNTHTVRQGDTLFSLARTNNITIYDIQKENNLGTTTIRVGQVLTIPVVSVPHAPVNISAGSTVGLENVPLFSSSTITTKTRNITGGFWLWDSDVRNGRIRITNSRNNVGLASQITGWVRVNDLK